jgi:hypothetical protein
MKHDTDGDGEPLVLTEEQRRMTEVERICQFMFAGNATITLRSAKTGARFTYKVTEHKERSDWFWVAYLSGPDNDGDFVSLGYFKATEFLRTKKWLGSNADVVRAFEFFARCLLTGRLHSSLEVFHESRCGACGRKLTVPESIQTGLGPVCAARRGIKCERVEDSERLMMLLEAEGDRAQTIRDERNKHAARAAMEAA